MSEKITLKLPKAVLDKVLKRAQQLFPLKEIKFYSDAALEALYVFVKEDATGNVEHKAEQKAEASQ